MLKKLIALGVLCVIALSCFSACDPKVEISKGAFYTLQEAYDNGWLTQEDLRSIAYYHHDGKKIVFDDSNFCYEWLDEEESYIPIPKIPECLDTETEKQIKQTHVNELHKAGEKRAETKGVFISRYYGTYNGYIAIVMKDNYSHYLVGGPFVIAGMFFSAPNQSELIIWKVKET